MLALLLAAAASEDCVPSDADSVTLNFEDAQLAHSNLGYQGGPKGESLLFPGENMSSASSDALVFADVGVQIFYR